MIVVQYLSINAFDQLFNPYLVGCGGGYYGGA